MFFYFSALAQTAFSTKFVLASTARPFTSAYIPIDSHVPFLFIPFQLGVRIAKMVNAPEVNGDKRDHAGIAACSSIAIVAACS